MTTPDQSEAKSKRTEWFKHLTAVLLIGLAWVIASIGRLALDWGIQEWPAYSAVIERVGGWLLGLVVAVTVLLPMFSLYGAFRRPTQRNRE
jgi:uncharacterized membrane protein